MRSKYGCTDATVHKIESNFNLLRHSEVKVRRNRSTIFTRSVNVMYNSNTEYIANNIFNKMALHFILSLLLCLLLKNPYSPNNKFANVKLEVRVRIH